MISVKKRSGEIVPFNIDKILNVVELACGENFKYVQSTDIMDRVTLDLHDEVTTEEIHSFVIKAAVSLISDTDAGYEYQYVAANLVRMKLYKDVYGSTTPISIESLLKTNFAAGRYSHNLTEWYTSEEMKELDAYIKRERDLRFTYSGIQQMIDKYLVKDRLTGKVYETPQDAFMLIPMFVFATENPTKRIDLIKEFYNAVSTFKINLPTPIMSGVRVSDQFSSCCVIDIGDSLTSILDANKAIGSYTAAKAGIGVNYGRIRGINASIRGGEVVHSGITPLLKVSVAVTRSLMQGGIRGGNSTTSSVWWHWEIQTFINLKSNKGTNENSVRDTDYSVAFNTLFRERVRDNADITLFSPEEVPGLYEATFSGDPLKFKTLYEKYEVQPNIRKKVVKARKLYTEFLVNRYETGRLYVFNADSINSHTPLGEPIVMSNLCQELASHTKPLVEVSLDDRVKFAEIEDTDYDKIMSWKGGEIAMCTLSNINLGKLHNIDEIPALAKILVRFLDIILTHQNYPVLEAQLSTFKNRYLGIGVGDVFHLLEKNFVTYDTLAGRNLIHNWLESFQYNVMLASNELAKEKGAAPNFRSTLRSRGLMPIDTYNRNVDELTNEVLYCDWATLSESIVQYGLRHNTLTMIPPAASSSIVSNCTAGVDPPRRRLIHKTSKLGSLPYMLPEGDRLQYLDTAWTIDNESYLKFIAVIQKFIDQSISTNLYYVPERMVGGKVSMEQLVRDDLTAFKYGVKTLYYLNVNDDYESISEETNACASGACEV